MGIKQVNLFEIEKSYSQVVKNWDNITKELIKYKIGEKDTPFNNDVQNRMLLAYNRLNELLENKIEPFSDESLTEMLELNNLVHYGKENSLRYEYNSAIQVTKSKFYNNIKTLSKWYKKHKEREDHPLKIASAIYVGIVGQPQLFVEGNHRTGSLIASWIDLYHGYAPFVLTVNNAIPYFAPSSEIKYFTDKSTWRGRRKLPKYKKSFQKIWELYIDEKYIKN